MCGGCDAPVGLRLEGRPETVACPRCGRREPLALDPAGPAPRLDRCQRCGFERLYVQKDFNRTIGLVVFVVAALLSVPTWGLSLVAATLIDLGLYYGLGDVTLCYACGAQHRGFARNPQHTAFDLHVAEAVERRPRTA